MAKRIYQFSMIGIVAIVIFGGFMAINGYNDDIYPLDRIRGNLDGIMGSSDPTAIKIHLTAIKQDLTIILDKLPESKNPVWIFPTESTNFNRIERDVNTMIVNIETISRVSDDGAAFQTGMTNIQERSIALSKNIMDATPYMYVSVSNILFSTIWIAAILGIFTALKRKKDQLTAFDQVTGV